MKLLLTVDVERLGIVGDVVEVSSGFARNYLLPQRKATEPTDANMRRLAGARKAAEERRRTLRESLLVLSEKLKEVEITIAAAVSLANLGGSAAAAHRRSPNLSARPKKAPREDSSARGASPKKC